MAVAGGGFEDTTAALVVVGVEAAGAAAFPFTTEPGAVTEYMELEGTAALAPASTEEPGALAVNSVDEILPGAVGTYPIEGCGVAGAVAEEGAAAATEARLLAAGFFEVTEALERTEAASPAVFFVLGLDVPIASPQPRVAEIRKADTSDTDLAWREIVATAEQQQQSQHPHTASL